jgi:hypothetical protein
VEEETGKIDSITSQSKIAENTALHLLTAYGVMRLFPYSPWEVGMYNANLPLFRSYGISDKQTEGLFKKEYVRFLGEMHNGNLDALVGAKPHTFVTVIDLCRQYRSAMPRTYYQMQELSLQIKIQEYELKDLEKSKAPRNKRREKESELKRLADKKNAMQKDLLSAYPEIYSKHRRILGAFYNGKKGLNTEDSVAIMRDFKAKYEAQGEKFLSRQEALEILEPLGIKSAILYIPPRNFV